MISLITFSSLTGGWIFFIFLQHRVLHAIPSNEAIDTVEVSPNEATALVF